MQGFCRRVLQAFCRRVLQGDSSLTVQRSGLEPAEQFYGIGIVCSRPRAGLTFYGIFLLMAQEQIVVRFSNRDELMKEFESNLRHGGAFARGVVGFERGQECTLVLVHPKNNSRLSLPATVGVVVTAGEKEGVGLAIKDFGREQRERLDAFVCNGVGGQSETAGVVGETVHQRIRGLTPAQQQKMARSRNVSERVALERMYGKFVWETLLRNSSITIPEVTRMARMGTMPRPLLELMVANSAWINTPQVRRALLSNPRLTGEMINKVVRAMPRNELKLAKKQTTYSQAVRNAVLKLLKS